MNDFLSDNIITIVAAAFVFEVLMGMLAQRIAEEKGHSKRWFWAGFLLSLVGAVWAAGLPDEALRRQLAGAAARRDMPAAVPQAIQPRTEAASSRIDKKLPVVLAAAVAAMGEGEGRRFVMRSFRPARESPARGNYPARGGAPPARG